MKLQEWLKANRITAKAFAIQIGKSPSLIHKYLHEDVIPSLESMEAIFLATRGMVMPGDFYNLPPLKLNRIKEEIAGKF